MDTKDPPPRKGELTFTSTFSAVQIQTSILLLYTELPTSPNRDRTLPTRKREKENHPLICNRASQTNVKTPYHSPGEECLGYCEEEKMARRSDFAQKLLDDLRLRKERMAASQSSKGSKSMAGDAYSYSKQTYRGSKEMKTNQTNGFKSGSVSNRSSGANKSLSVEAASKQLVPYERGRNSEQIGDLSKALAFALENGGRLKRMDSSGNNSMLGFLNQIGRQSAGFRMTEGSCADRHHSTIRFPTLSHLHIKEIAKGAQKLNEILRACSNGLNFDRYSIEIGKELLKGAMDLEESLRMLVNLQEASEYMIKPQNRNRITLLDEEDDNENTIEKAELMQLDRPRFSFDKPSSNSRYSQEVARTDLKQTLMTLTYLSEATNSYHDRHSLSASTSVSHKRSIKNGPIVKAALSEEKNQSSSSKSKPEKGRIPNVIAKLMGLEELPENEDSKHAKQKESTSKKKIEGLVIKKPAGGSSTHERKRKDADHLVSAMRKQKQIQPNNIQVIQDSHTLQAEKDIATRHANFGVTAHDRKQPQTDMEGIIQTKGSNKIHMRLDRHQNSTGQSNQITGSRKGVQEREKKQENAKIREQKGKEKGGNKEAIAKHELQQMVSETQNGSQATVTLQRHIDWNVSMHKAENRDAKRLPSDQPKSPNDLGFQQPYMHREFESLHVKHHEGESGQQGTKQNIQVRRQKDTEETSRSLPKPTNDILNLPKKHSNTSQSTTATIESINATQSKAFPNNSHHEYPVHDRSSTNSRMSTQYLTNRNSNENSSSRDPKNEFPKEKTRTPPAIQEKSIHLSAPQKVKNTKALTVETPRKIDELMVRRSGIPRNLAKLQKHQTPVSHGKRDTGGGSNEAKKLRISRSKEIETSTIKYSKSVASVQKSDKLEELHAKAEDITNFSNPPADDELRNREAPEILAPNESFQHMRSAMTTDEQGQGLDFGKDELSSHNLLLNALNGTHEDNADIKYFSVQENHKPSKFEPPEPLTESENHLQQILVKSQLFLNTAEALFNLNIPFGILHAGGQDCHAEESKLTLDAGYEIMKRKGKIQELSIHPFMSTSIASVKIRSLDHLIKQLDKDFKKLKFYGRDGNDECGVENYLPKMLENDVHNWDPPVNSMWDFGWNMMMSAFLERDEVVRDVERFVLNGLLDEVTRDLVLVF